MRYRICTPLLAAVAALGTLTDSACAQSASTTTPRFELRSFAGGFVPTGARRTLLKSGVTTGAQMSATLTKHAALVGSFAWAGLEVKSASPDVNVYQYDLGAELGRSAALTQRLAWRPFVGAGVGGRSYDFRDGDTDAQHNVAGYAAAGAQLLVGRFGVHVELRDYVSSFKGLSGERADRDASNDLRISTGVAVRF